ncbi:MAG: phasin family protein [Xanthobacteraceae bacterium]
MASFSTSFSLPPTVHDASEPMRAFVEQGMTQARLQYARFKDVAADGNGAVEVIFSVASKGTGDYSVKLASFFQANAAAAFELTQQLSAVRTLSQAMEVWDAYMRRQMGLFAGQSRQLMDLSRQVATDATAPIRASVEKLLTPSA